VPCRWPLSSSYRMRGRAPNLLSGSRGGVVHRVFTPVSAPPEFVSRADGRGPTVVFLASDQTSRVRGIPVMGRHHWKMWRCATSLGTPNASCRWHSPLPLSGEAMLVCVFSLQQPGSYSLGLPRCHSSRSGSHRQVRGALKRRTTCSNTLFPENGYLMVRKCCNRIR